MALTAWTQITGSADTLAPFQYQIASKSGESNKQSFSNWNPSNSGIPVVYIVGWSCADNSSNNLKNFCSDILGYSYLDAMNNIHRVLPQNHPDYALLYADNVVIEGLGTCGKTATGYPEWTIAKVTVEFKPFPFLVVADADTDSEADRYMERVWAFDSQYLTLQGKMKFVSGSPNNPPLATQPGFITGTQELTYVWKQVPAIVNDFQTPPNLKALINCFGRVNTVPFDPDNFDAPAGTMLFMSCEPKLQLPTIGGAEAGALFSGLYYWEIAMKFSYRHNGYYNTSDRRLRPTTLFNPGSCGQLSLNGSACGHNYIYRTYGQVAGWSATANYAVNDVVTKLGSAYRCVTANTNQTPPNATFWTLLADPGLNLPFWDYVTNDGTVTGAPMYQQADLNQLFTITG